MVKHILAIALISGLVACSTTEKQIVSAKDQVAGAEKMCSENASAMKQRQQQRSLYSRLGERDGIEKFSTNLYAAHQSNDQIGHRFKGVDQQKFITNVTNFIVSNSGGGGEYQGRNMISVHKSMDITHADFLAAGGDVQAVLKDLGRGENEIQEVVCFLVSLSQEVITR